MKASSAVTYSGRLQVPARSKDDGSKEKLVVEFDFDSTSTGIDVLRSVLEQIADSFTIDAPSLESCQMRLKDLPAETAFPCTDRLVSRDDVRSIFEGHNAKPLSKAPMFLTVPPQKQVSGVSPKRSPRGTPRSRSPAGKSNFDTMIAMETSFGVVQQTRAQASSLEGSLLATAPPAAVRQREAAPSDGGGENLQPLIEVSTEERLRHLFGADYLSTVDEMPIEDLWQNKAAILVEKELNDLKDIRSNDIPERKHWIHFLFSTPPTRERWIGAIGKEVKAYQEYASSVLVPRKKQLEERLAATKSKQQSELAALQPIEVAAAKAREIISRRDELQDQLDNLRAEVEAQRTRENKLVEKLRLARSKMPPAFSLSASSTAGAPKSANAPRTDEVTPAAYRDPSCLQLVADEPRAAIRSMPSDQKAARDDEGEVYFDELPSSRATNAFDFLSPNLRIQVKEVLEAPNLASGAGNSSGREGGMSSTTGGKADELRVLAQELTEYLNTSSPDPETRAKLLLQVRRAREAVEKKKGIVPSISSSPNRAGGASLQFSPISRHQTSAGDETTRLVDELSLHPYSPNGTADSPSGQRSKVSSQPSAMNYLYLSRRAPAGDRSDLLGGNKLSQPQGTAAHRYGGGEGISQRPVASNERTGGDLEAHVQRAVPFFHQF